MVRKVDFNKSQGYWNYLKAIRVNQLLLLFTVICLALLTATVQAAPVEEWSKTFGGTSVDFVYSVQQTSEGGYILAGYTYSYGAGYCDAWIIKTDTNGNQQWNKTYGGPYYDEVLSVQQTSDGGYILAGCTNSYGAGYEDAWLIKTDTNGNQQWNKTFGGTYVDWAYSVQQTSDDGYILAGSTGSYGAGYEDAWLIKTDTNGNQQWNKTFGGIKDDVALSVRQTSDGGYILTGYTDSYGTGYDDVWLVKTDTYGNQQWNKTFGGTNDEWTYSVQQTSEGGYILIGYTESYGAGYDDAWLIKTDISGNQLWNKTFGGTNSDRAFSVQQTSDGGYIIAGFTSSYGTYNGDAWLIKTDTNGNQMWNKTFGETYVDCGYSVQQTSDGGYILAGITAIETGYPDAWLIKVSNEEEILMPDSIGVYNNEGTWALWNTTSSSADIVGFGWLNTKPVVGDWDGDSITEVGIYNTGGNNFLIQIHSGFDVIGLGWEGVTPVVGCWN